MTDPALTAGQYSIGADGSSSAFVYGGRPGTYANSIQVQNTAVSTGNLAVQDQAVAGQDGMIFGVDTLPGMVITQTGQANAGPGQGAAALDAYSALAGAWNNPAIRLTDGAVAVLRACYPGSGVVRRCYGRGRQIMPAYGLVNQGLVPFTSQFQAADNTWYEDVQLSIVLSTVPSLPGTLTPPLTPPYQLTSQANTNQTTAVNTGSLPTWPVITFTGPVSYPVLTYVNTPVSVGYNGVITSGQSLVIDTRPWARTALLQGASVAGLLTGSPMIGMQLQPGSTLVRLGGQDTTGQGRATLSWRSATLSIGGTS